MSELCEGLKKFPGDYTVLCQMTELKNLLFVGTNVAHCASQIESTEFFKWLNDSTPSDSTFLEIKKKWIQKEIVKPLDFAPETMLDFSEKYLLELTCAGIVKYFISNVHMVQKFSSTYDGYSDIDKAIDVIYKKYSTALVVENVAQQLLLVSLDFLKKQGGIQSPFFSHKQDQFLARRTMIKMALYFLYLALIPDFFLVHASDFDERALKDLSMQGYENGVVFCGNVLYDVKLTLEPQTIAIQGSNTDIETLKTQCSRLLVNQVCPSNCITMFDLCEKATNRSFMKYSSKDHFVIETVIAIVRHFFDDKDSKITNSKEIKAMAKKMKQLALEQKVLKKKIETTTIAEFLLSDFSEFV